MKVKRFLLCAVFCFIGFLPFICSKVVAQVENGLVAYYPLDGVKFQLYSPPQFQFYSPLFPV